MALSREIVEQLRRCLFALGTECVIEHGKGPCKGPQDYMLQYPIGIHKYICLKIGHTVINGIDWHGFCLLDML